MAEEKKEERMDADGGQTLDKLLKGIDAVTSKLDAMAGRMDAMEKRMDDDDTKRRHDAEEKEEEERKDARSKKDDDDDDRRAKKDDDDDDRRAKKDDAKRSKKDDDDAKRRHDAEPEEEMEGEPEPVAADKKRRAKKDDEDDRKDDDDARAKKDDDDDDDKSRKDSSPITRADLKRLAEDIRKDMPRAHSAADASAFADVQARHDDICSLFGESASRPLQGEDLLSYRVRMASKLKKYHPAWKDVDLKVIAIDEAGFAVAENQILEHAGLFARNPASVPAGQLRAVPRKLSGGHSVTEFFGDPASWMARFASTGRSVAKINMMKGN